MDAKDKIIEDLQKLVAMQSDQIAKLTARVAELELALARAKKDSSTSSKPPSSDITRPKTSKNPGRRGKPKRGGQAGHQQHLRKNLPPDRVDVTFDHEITDDGERYVPDVGDILNKPIFGPRLLAMIRWTRVTMT